MKDFIQLHPADNVVVALKDLPEASVLDVSGNGVSLKNDIDFGHKIAIIPIKAGEKVLKYGLPIGSATRDIAAGEHVHTQNLTTDYTLKSLL